MVQKSAQLGTYGWHYLQTLLVRSNQRGWVWLGIWHARKWRKRHI